MPEGEKRLNFSRVEVSVAHHETFAVGNFSTSSRIGGWAGGMSGDILQTAGESAGQLARGSRITEKNTRNRGARFHAAIPRLQHGGHGIKPRIHRHRRAGNHYHDRSRVGFDYAADQFVLAKR